MPRIAKPFRSSAVAAVIATALAPGAAFGATTWFGSSFSNDPANAGSYCNPIDPSQPGPVCTRVGSYFPGTSGRVKAPVSGTIVKIRVRAAGPMTMTFKVVRVRHLSSNHEQGQAKLVQTGPKLKVKGPSATQLGNGVYPIESFKVKLAVHKGDELAIDTKRNQAEYCANGTPGQLTFSNPVLKASQGWRSSNGTIDCLLLVQAVIKH